MTALAATTQPVPVLEKIHEIFPRLTKSERAVAAYITANLRALPFETATSIARKVGVSQMTVGRLLRTLGYARLSELKDELNSGMGDAPWLIRDRYERFAHAGATGAAYRGNLELEIKALIGVYEITKDERWTELVDCVANAEALFVTGFQSVRGVALELASRLEYVRDGVRFLDGKNGTYAELFARNREEAFLILIDIRRYARQSRLLAGAARDQQIPLAIVTDAFCSWARDYTDNVYYVSTDTGLFWDSTVGIAGLLNLLVNDVIRTLGPKMAKRMKELQALQSRFDAFQD